MRRSVRKLMGWGVLGVCVATLAWADEPRADISKPGTYTSGPWKYCLKITLPGSKSEGLRGELFYDGKPVNEPGRGDYYHTPWGDVQWVGDSPMLWGAHGWMLRRGQDAGGRRLAEPWIEAGGPLVMAMLLQEMERPQAKATLEPWVQKELEQQGVKAVRVQRDWFPLSDQAVTLHDTKLFGTLTARVAPARRADTLTLILDGSRPELVELPRKNGATRLVVRPMGGVLAEVKYVLALRVERAAPGWPRPLDVGPEATGKQVVVRGTREVVIGLPGDRNSGLEWVVKRVRGDGPMFSSVRASGTPQFTPAIGAQAGSNRAGTFENVFSVTGIGKSYVELELKRTWQKDVPPAKTFTVTLDVQSVVDTGAERP